MTDDRASSSGTERPRHWRTLQVIAYGNYAFGLLATITWLTLFPGLADDSPEDGGLGRWPVSLIGLTVIGGLGSTVQITVTTIKLIKLSRNPLGTDLKQSFGRPWLIPWWIKLCYGAVLLTAVGITAGLVGGGIAAFATVLMSEMFLGWMLLGVLFCLGVFLLVVIVMLAAEGSRKISAALSKQHGEERLVGLGRGILMLGVVVLLVGVVPGAAAYSSPRPRDLGPLLGLTRDDVDIRLPALLHAAQLFVWCGLLMITGGLILQPAGFIIGARTQPGREQ